MNKEEKIHLIYSKEVDLIIKKQIMLSEEQGRITINEWRNFIDYDIIQILRKYLDLIEKSENKK